MSGKQTMFFNIPSIYLAGTCSRDFANNRLLTAYDAAQYVACW